jgi:hypothetical protein
MAPQTRKKTDIPIPEPRHRVGPKGVSSGISFRELPPPSLDEIKKVCEHYQTKCAGTYDSLASRYVYQMATEIEDLVEALEGGYGSEGSLSSLGGCEPFAPFRVSTTAQRSKKQRSSSANDNWKRGRSKRGRGGDTSKTSFNRPPTRHSRHSKTDDRRGKEIRFDFADDDDSSDVPYSRDRQPCLGRQKYNTSSTTKYSCDDMLEQRNFEDQVQEVLGWLKDEMERSQSLVLRSRQIHDAELANARREIEKLKRAAKRIIKAVHKNGKDKAARSEAMAESERKRRVKSQKIMASMIKSHAEQMEHLKRGLHHNSASDSDSLAGLGLDLEDDSHTMRDENNPAELFSLAGDSDLTSILDGLAEEAYRQAYYH